MPRMENLKELEILNSLFYSLAGLNTDLLSSTFVQQYADESVCDKSINSYSQILPFKFLIHKICDFKSISVFTPFIVDYFKKISLLKQKVKSIEELYIGLRDQIEIFEELNKLLDEFKSSKGNSVTNILFEDDLFTIPGNNSSVNNALTTKAISYNFNRNFYTNFLGFLKKDLPVYKVFRAKYVKLIISQINQWINSATFTSLVAVSNYKEFSKCFWTDMLTFTPEYFDIQEADDILTCGKIVYLIHSVFSLEIVTENTQVELLSVLSPDVIKSLNDKYPLDKVLLKPIEYDKYKIKERRVELETRLCLLLKHQVQNEIRIIYDISLLRNSSPLYEIFCDISELSSTLNINENLDSHFKAQQFRFNQNDSLFDISSSKTPLSVYLLKLLKVEDVIEEGDCNRKGFAETLQLNFYPRHLQLFISFKTITELKIINRFFILISYFLYKFESKISLGVHNQNKHSFTQIIYLILNQLKLIKIENTVPSFSVLEFQSKFKKQIKSLLHSFYLTNGEIFLSFTKIFDLCHEYLLIDKITVEIENLYFNKGIKAVSNLHNTIIKFGEDDFTDYLKYFIS